MTTATIPPVIVDLGVTKKKAIRNLKCGRGPALVEVERVLDTVRTTLAADVDGKVLVPIVMVYKKRPKRRRVFKGLGVC